MRITKIDTNSIFFKIRVSFVISIVLTISVFALFYFIHQHYGQMETKERLLHASKVSKHLRDEPDELRERLLSLELELVDDENRAMLMKKGISNEFARMGPMKLFVIEYESKRYLGFTHPMGVDIFLDKKPSSPTLILLLVALVAIFGVLTLFYHSIYKSLYPLSEITEMVERFDATGEIISVKHSFCEELEALSAAFEKMAINISDTSKARTLFLRNIAHELKTPLSKGRFIAEMVSEENTRERLHLLFGHFDNLINELLQIEKLTAKGMLLVKKEYMLQDCIDEAVDGGFLDESAVVITDCDMMVSVDFRLFVLALKNLLQNGIKHSSDGRVIICVENGVIKISNIGEPLKQKIELLEQPFVKGDESSEGLGLGLYIVRQVVDLHMAKIKYEYIDSIHSFSIIF